ncbi:hypothetical protein MLD38_023216 [Melastoma candidum]|uniref:Uncharacterized protein n=1 Tax=Melastoma candidum TaxID=119954 RepID=A0ACB9QL48_9MYRT|nr:hypothetical protein MLD38_023216 [Melastoma candidum]
MRYFLMEKMGFPSESILTLTEDEANPYLIPTKRNILSAMNWLVQGCKSGDSFVFHFSGHGSRQRNIDMDEIDGYDECLCPVDFEVAGKIVDDDINAILVRPLPHGTKLHAIIDTCYSGTMLDLPFLCQMSREGCYTWEDHRRPLAAYKGSSGGIAISFSACDDHQIAVDTTALSGNVVTGAMTYSFIQAMERDPGCTYGCLLNTMRNCINDTRTGLRLNGPIAAFLNRIIGAELSQEPQLTSSAMFDVYTSRIAL